MMEKSLEKYLLKCSICNKPLSVAPIYHNDFIGSICGRCTHEGILSENEGSSLERQIIFEEVAKHLTFPCSYQAFGCKVTLKWGSIECHENTCPFNIIVCPLSHAYFRSTCSWVDQPLQLGEHIKRKHKNMFSSPPKIEITQNFQNKTIFWELMGRVIIISLIFNHEMNKHLCFIMGDFAPELCDSFLCQIEINKEKMTNPVIIQHKGVQPFCENYLNKPEKGFEIDINHYRSMLSHPNELILTFNVTKAVDPEKNEFNQQLLQSLECPICREYIRPPIFICETGHNICEICSKRVNMCPICRGNFLGGRNFTLESFTSNLDYPCVNQLLGCFFIGKAQLVQKHELLCEYIEIECVTLNCQWRGLDGDLKKHLKAEHMDVLLQQDNTYAHHSNKDFKDYLFLYVDDIFILKLYYENGQDLKFAVLHYQCKTTSRYKYDFKIMGFPSFNISITMSDECQSVRNYNDVRNGKYRISLVPFNLLTQFMFEFEHLDFKFNLKCE